MNKIKIAIIDDHQIVLDGLQILLNNAKEISIIAATSSPQKIIELVTENKIDLLLTDIYMPEMTGIELAKEVYKINKTIRIIALSMNNEAAIVEELINEVDIGGYLLKTINKEELIHAINTVANGGCYFSDGILEQLKNAQIQKKETDKKAALLTPREIEIISLIAKEYSNKKIAAELFISERTVETHRKNIFRKTETHTVIGLLQFVNQYNIPI